MGIPTVSASKLFAFLRLHEAILPSAESMGFFGCVPKWVGHMHPRHDLYCARQHVYLPGGFSKLGYSKYSKTISSLGLGHLKILNSPVLIGIKDKNYPKKFDQFGIWDSCPLVAGNQPWQLLIHILQIIHSHNFPFQPPFRGLFSIYFPCFTGSTAIPRAWKGMVTSLISSSLTKGLESVMSPRIRQTLRRSSWDLWWLSPESLE